jgi:hypothetical protein
MRVLRSAALLCLVACLTVGCASKVMTIKLATDDPEHIWLQYFVDADGKPIPQGYQHPAQLAPEQIKKIFEAVSFEEYSFFTWRKVDRVFSDSEVKRLQEPVSKALAQATADQWVHFATTDMKREFLAITATRHLTDGICFVKDGKFNLVLGNVNFELIAADRELWRADPRDRFYFDSFRLFSDPAHGIAIPPIVLNDKWFKKRRVNWLVFDLEKFMQPPAPAPTTPADVTERLRKLKEPAKA